MPRVLRPPLISLGLLLIGCGSPGGNPRAVSDSTAAPRDTAPQAHTRVAPAPAEVPAAVPREARPPAAGRVPGGDRGDARDDAELAQASPLGRECITNRRSGFRGRAGEARFDMDRDDPRFRPRSATLTRRVLCGFQEGKLAKSAEQFYLQLVSQDMNNPGFSTGPHLSARYYLVCEGSVRTTLPTFLAGQVLSYADNTFTLPCTHAVYPTGVAEPAKASRITGRVGYRMQSAVLEVRRGPTLASPGFDVALDVVVVNQSDQRETLHLRGRVFGELSTTFTIVDCPTERRYTKEVPHPACP